MNHLQKLSQGFKKSSVYERRIKSLFGLNLPLMSLDSKRPLKVAYKEEIHFITRCAPLYHITGFTFSSIPNEADEDDLYEAGWLHSDGQALFKIGQFGEALENFKRSLEIRRRVDKGNHRETTALLSNMGDSLKELGKLQEAIDCYKEALETNDDADDYWNLLR